MARVEFIPVRWLALGLAIALLSAGGWSAAVAEMRVSPASVKLDRPEASQQLLITEVTGEKQRDATREAKYEVKPPMVVRVDADGLMEPLEEGTTTVVVKVGAAQIEIPVVVTGLKAPPPVSFEHEIQPILTKNRCNAGGIALPRLVSRNTTSVRFSVSSRCSVIGSAPCWTALLIRFDTAWSTRSRSQ